MPAIINLPAVRRSWRQVRRFGRILAGSELWARPEVRLPTERLGSDYGGWTFWPAPLGGESVVYSFGVGEDITFDLSLIAKFGCALHAFDPTPRSIAWVRRQTLPAQFHFHDYGLSNKDGLASFVPPTDPSQVSYRMTGEGTVAAAAEQFPVRRLAPIAAELGHERIDLLKMDIEGAEYDVLEDLLATDLWVGQILVEFHHRSRAGWLGRTRRALEQLRGAGYRLFEVAPTGEEYSFVNQNAAPHSKHEHCANAA